MVKSSGACFKIIACGSDSVDHEDLQAPESKSSDERRGWSFRKRSARHRVLSNTIISEAPSSVKKESPESTDVNVLMQSNLTTQEKFSGIQGKEEKTELSARPNIKILDTIADNVDDSSADATYDESSTIVDDSSANATYDESSINVIQAAIRRSLAQRLLSKQKNIIKLQAAIRGHLVRRHAVGTLRCVQAIVKMQVLVRARRARLLVEESCDFEKQNASRGKNNPDPRSEREAKTNISLSYISIEKLLSNGFARQLLESTPESKSINIKCDPLRSDSAWKWLERWMSVSSVSNAEVLESGSGAGLLEKNNLEHSEGKVDCVVPSDHYPEQTNLAGLSASVEASVNDNDLISCEEDDVDLQVCKSTSPSSSHPDLQNIDKSDLTHIVTETVINLEAETISEPACVEITETDLNLKVDAKSLPDNEETVHEIDLPNVNNFSSEQPEIDTKKLSRKASNPSFLAAQSKFEELSSAANNAMLESSSNLDHDIEYDLDDEVCTSTDQQPFRSQGIESAENPISNAPAGQIGGSKCGTQLSISSTLDSPDRSEVGVNDIKQNPKIADESDHSTSGENFVLDINGISSILEPDQSHKNINHLPRDDSGNSATVECDNSVVPTDSPPLEKKPEPDLSGLQLELGSEASHLLHKQSPEASPRSHTTVTESQATPSRVVSSKPKKKRGEKSESSYKIKSLSADKKSLPSSNQDSASRSSMEQLPKEHKPVKRRNSFGSAKPDNADQEPRDSSSSNSLPSYMQATESARAKAIPSGSPRSSPDLHEKDIYIKKRRSLPGSNGRHGSPRIQRTLSQAQQNAKGNGTHSPQDRKWRR
ncbi:protein IQ-DOMAIN 32-like isoform X1 [Primulina huaijiensis]|uniref:protein IQ-DOMAIN 32-like isoform X1 n=1 Tax=Primulina huaijiensis TaxID=1492673 RepID=UPI003CC74211